MGGYGGFIIMHPQLQSILIDIETRIVQKDIKRFKIGITDTSVEERFKNGYDDEDYTHISEIAYGNKEAVKQAEKDLIQWALKNTSIKYKCENQANGGGNIENVRYVYIVAESSTVSENKCERLLEDLPKTLLENFYSVQL